MIILVFYFIGLVSGAIAGFSEFTSLGTPFDFHVLAPTVFRYFMAFGAGLCLVTCAIGHVFKSDSVAERIGWPKGSPFQKEVGYWDGAAGVGALLCFTQGPEYWLGIVIVHVLFWITAGLNHAVDRVRHKNKAVDNVIPAFADLAFGSTIVVFYLFSR